MTAALTHDVGGHQCRRLCAARQVYLTSFMPGSGRLGHRTRRGQPPDLERVRFAMQAPILDVARVAEWEARARAALAEARREMRDWSLHHPVKTI